MAEDFFCLYYINEKCLCSSDLLHRKPEEPMLMYCEGGALWRNRYLIQIDPPFLTENPYLGSML